ncbi:hypothetical protein DERP_013250 [Dermatophagoides pteronyssinus]|uniref:Uncharacterized protein n=1 Tax=Dermatophagoides pteronyssinus TaxID=6956 RepID=A0ABQ8IRJ3_DERPT|nr:hypothetical protein DERP_013250 [Dermatophagoides pteronyssinus]
MANFVEMNDLEKGMNNNNDANRNQTHNNHYNFYEFLDEIDLKEMKEEEALNNKKKSICNRAAYFIMEWILKALLRLADCCR